jgi:hypothetical protein
VIWYVVALAPAVLLALAVALARRVLRVRAAHGLVGNAAQLARADRLKSRRRTAREQLAQKSGAVVHSANTTDTTEEIKP